MVPSNELVAHKRQRERFHAAPDKLDRVEAMTRFVDLRQLLAEKNPGLILHESCV